MKKIWGADKKKFVINVYILNMILVLFALIGLAVIIRFNFATDTKEQKLAYSNSALKRLEEYMIEKEQFLLDTLTDTYIEAKQSNNVFDYLDSKNELSMTKTAQQNVDNFLVNNFNASYGMNSIYIYSPKNDRVFAQTNGKGYTFSSDSEVFDNLVERYQREKSAFVQVLPSTVYKSCHTSRSFSLIYYITSLSDYSRIGTIGIDFKVSDVTRFLDRFYKDNRGDFIVVTDDGRVIYDSTNLYYDSMFPYMNITETQDGVQETISVGEEEYFVNQTEISYLNLKIIGLLSVDDVYQNVNKSFVQLIIVMALLFAVISVVGYLDAQTKSIRLEKVQNAMLQAQKGNLQAYINIDYHHEDELTDISYSFNQMLKELNAYIEKAYLAELQKQQYQMLALRAQINPHFLYNTFEAIRMKAIIDGENDIADMVFILSKIYRNAIKGEGVISIGTEMENCENYLLLHKIRYQEQLRYEFIVDEKIVYYAIVQFALQVMIENYIFHGFDNGRTDNFINIIGQMQDNMIVVQVVDNGFGMSEEDKERLLKSFGDTDISQQNSIGLRNVYQRMRLAYGEDFEFRLESELKVGTKIWLKFKACTSEELKEYV